MASAGCTGASTAQGTCHSHSLCLTPLTPQQPAGSADPKLGTGASTGQMHTGSSRPYHQATESLWAHKTEAAVAPSTGEEKLEVFLQYLKSRESIHAKRLPSFLNCFSAYSFHIVFFGKNGKKCRDVLKMSTTISSCS